MRPENRSDTAGGTGPGGSYAASDLRSAYVIPGFGGNVSQTVALFEQFGFLQSDITVYESQNSLPNVPVQEIGVDGSRTGVVDANLTPEDVFVRPCSPL